MQLSVRAMRPWAFLGALLLSLFAKPLAAQETGKIQGRVTDATSGQPIVGAQVVIVGTRLGNITNEDGFYFVNNVPAGLQDIQAQYIGYQTVTVRQQRVLAGQTLTQNFALAQAAVEIAALEVIGETRPLVPRDQVASKNIVTGEAVEELPVDDVTNIVRLQPGVVQTGRKGGVSIRGGRSGEEAVFVDGVLVRNFNEGSSNLTIGTNTLAEVDVLTGGFSAEFGEAQSGIINYVTRSGGRAWNGTLSLQTDELMPTEWSIGFNRAELSVGGPVVGNLSFFAAGTATGRKSDNMGIEWRDFPIFVAQGVDTVIAFDPTGKGDVREVPVPNFVRFDEGGRAPFSNSDEYTLDGKLDYSYGSGSRLFITGKMSRNQDRSQFGGGRVELFNTQGFGGVLAKSRTAILGLTHNFVRSAESALSIDLKVARQHDFALSGNLDQEWDLDHRNPTFGFTFDDFEFQVDEDDFPVDQALVERFLRNVPDDPASDVGSRTPFPQSRTDLLGSTEFRMNPFGIITRFNTRGVGGTFGFAEEKQWQFRAAVDWQVNRQNRLKFGGDWFDIDLARANIRYTNLSFAQLWVENPKRQSLFAQDRLDLGDVVVEAGLRWDRFDPNSNFPVVPGFFDLDDPTSFEPAPVRTALSPRLGVSFPVTVNSTFRLSYGHFTQLPDLNEYYRGKNTDFFRFRNTNTNDLFTQPLDLGKTVAFEFGFRQLLAPDFVLDIAAYNRDKLKDVTSRKLAWEDPTNPGAVIYLNTFVNADFGTVRGVDIRLDRRFGQVFDAMVGYSYQDARSTGTDPFTYVNVFARLESNANTLLGLPPNPAQAIRLTEENRKHNITGNFSLQFPSNHENSLLANFGLFGTLRVLSGLPYSPLTQAAGNIFIAGQAGGAGLGVTGAELEDDEISTARLPWMTFFDLKAQKGLKLMGWNAQVFVDARNVLDLNNQTGIFQTTGDITDEAVYETRVEAHRQTLGGGTIQDRVDLRSLTSAGEGVRNEVDLFLLQQAEARFGNGDQIFEADEQERAFRAAEVFLTGPQDLFGPGRRVRLGFELTF
ncbi:MAG: TonB-dependent receptor [Gemmatimonadota bacterium]